MCIRDSSDTRLLPNGSKAVDALVAKFDFDRLLPRHRSTGGMLQMGCDKNFGINIDEWFIICLLYTSDAADERSSVDLGGRRIIKKKKLNYSAESGTHVRISN